MITIRQKIEKRISDAGFKKKEFAELIDAHPGSLNAMLESPSWPTLNKIANALNLSVSELVADDDYVSEMPKNSFICPHCGHELKITIE